MHPATPCRPGMFLLRMLLWASLAATASGQAPVVTTPPLSKLVVAGQPVTFTVAATGAGSLTYQWSHHGQPLPGAAGATLTVPAGQPAHSGWYEVEVENAAGTARAVVHASVVHENGAVVAWGDSYNGQTQVPAGLGNVVAIAAGRDTYVLGAEGGVRWVGSNRWTTLFESGVMAVSAGGHLLALRTDGTVGAAGDNFYGQTTIPAGLDRVVRVAAGSGFSLALRSDGSVVAWGDSYSGQTSPPAGAETLVDLAAGGQHAVGLRRDGTVVAWGSNASGQTAVPAGLAEVVAVAAGGAHSLALRRDGTVVAWGDNADGQCSVPAGLGGVTAIRSGGSQSLALRSDGEVVAWGGASKPWGLGTVPAAYEIRAVRAVAAGFAHNVVLVAPVRPTILAPPASQSVPPGGTASLAVAVAGTRPLSYVWRRNGSIVPGATSARLNLAAPSAADAGSYTVEIGNAGGIATSVAATLTVADAPVFSVRPLSRRVRIGEAATFTASASGVGAISYQWRHRGQPMAGATGMSLTLDQVSPAARGWYDVVATDAAGGRARSLFFVHPVPIAVARGIVRAWGGVPTGTYPASALPRDPIALSAGTLFTLALEGDGTVSQWGGNGFEQYYLPPNLGGVAAVTAGPRTAWAVKADGRLWEWSGSTVAEWTGVTEAVAVVADEYSATALLADGTVVERGAWYSPHFSDVAAIGEGVALAGGLGGVLVLRRDGTVASLRGARAVPPPAGLNDVVAVAVGDAAYFALKADGTVTGWGSGPAAAVPAGLAGVIDLAAGSGHAVAIKSDGAVVAWGSGTDQQTAVPAGAAPAAAVAAGWNHSASIVPATAPAILQSPGDQSLLAGGSLTLAVSAAGVAPIAYRWFKDGVALADGPGVAGAGSATLALSGLQPAASGTYTVAVTDATGSATSPAARVTVIPLTGGEPPANDAFAAAQALAGPAGTVAGQNLTATGEPGEPAHAAANPGSAASSVWYAWTAPGAGRVNFSLNGTDFPGTLALYSGTALAGLTLLDRSSSDTAAWAPVLSRSVRGGDTIRVAVAGTLAPRGSIRLSWTFSPAPAHDDCAAAVPLTAATGAHSGTNLYATAEPGEASREGSTTSVWHAWTAPADGRLALRAVNTMYQYVVRAYRGTAIGALVQMAELIGHGAYHQQFGIPERTFEVTAGTTYRFSLGSQFSGGGAYTLEWELLTMPVVAVPPADRIAGAGDTVEFGVTATGGRLSYQWFHDGLRIPGATAATLQLGGVSRAGAGEYHVRVANAAGATLSPVARLRGPAQAPMIVTAPAGVQATAGQPATLGVAATGTGQLAYQWRRFGVPLAGATAASLRIEACSLGDADYYDVLVFDGLSRTVPPAVRLAVAPVSYPGLQLFAAAPWQPERATAGGVNALATLPDGGFLVGGDFETVGGSAVSKVARFRADGTVDRAFVPPTLAGTVRWLVPLPGGSVLVGGDPLSVPGENRSSLVRLGPNGSLDRAFAPFPLSGQLYGVLRDAAGRILVHGSLSQTPISRNIYRLNADGTIDASFSGSVAFTAFAAALQPDGGIVVGGGDQGILRLLPDGAPDPTFGVTSWRASGVAAAVLVREDGRILAGGTFYRVGGGAPLLLALLAANGQVETGFSPPADLDQGVRRLVADGGGRVFVIEYGGRLRRLEASGAPDLTFAPRAAAGTSYEVAVEADGRVLLGMSLSSSTAASTLQRLSPTGAAEPIAVAVPRKAGEVKAMAPLPGGATLVAGNFSAWGGVSAAGLVRLKPDGSADPAFAPPDTLGTIAQVMPQADGGCLVLSHGEIVRRLRADGSLDPAFSLPAPLYLGEWPQVVNYPGGRFLVTTGAGVAWNGETLTGLMLLGPDGLRDSAFTLTGAPESGVALALAAYPDGRVLVGGSFNRLNGMTAPRLARLLPDGRTDSTFSLGTGFDHDVRAVHLHGDGRLVVAGTFTTCDGAASKYVARLNPDGSRDTSFVSAAPLPAKSILVQEDGRVVVTAAAAGMSSAPPAADLVVRLNADGSRDASWLLLGQPNEAGPLLMTDAGRLRAGVVSTSSSIWEPAVPFGLAEYSPATAPIIGTPPATIAAEPGETATFAVSATGTGELRYQWSFNGRAIAGATNATLTLTTVQRAQSGAYTVAVGNDFGTTASPPALLKGPNPLPAIVGQPAAVSARAGDPVVLNVTATATGAVGYQWQANGLALAGATGATLNLGPATLAQNGNVYDVIVFDGLSVTVSQPAPLAVVPSGTPEVLRADPAYAPAFEVAGGQILKMVRAPDGRAFVAGLFSRLGGVRAWNVARLRTDGTADATFAPVVSDGPISVLEVQADGRLLIAGGFSRIDGQVRGGVARLESDGALDPSFAPAQAFSEVKVLHVLPDGRILVGGGFATGGGVVRLHPDGSRDSQFNNTSLSGFFYDLALQADGRIVAGGSFSGPVGLAHSRFARLLPDGALDTSFNVAGAVPNLTVKVVRVLGDERILVGGDFQGFGTATVGCLMRLTPAGALDPEWQGGAGFTTYSTSTGVEELELQSDGRLLVKGGFYRYGSVNVRGLVRLQPNGALDTSFQIAASVWVATAFTLLGDGRLVLGGNIVSQLTLANADGTVAANPLNGSVYSPSPPRHLVPWSGGKVVAVGTFTHVNGTGQACLARLHANGSLDQGLAAPTPAGGFSGSCLWAMAQADGTLVVSGLRHSSNSSGPSLVRLLPNGTDDPTFRPTPEIGAVTYVDNPFPLPRNRLLLLATSYATGNILARLAADGSLEATLPAPGSSSHDLQVKAVAEYPDGRLLIAGDFTRLAGAEVGRLLRYRATGDRDVGFAPAADAVVHALALQPDGRIVIGGDFLSVNGAPAPRIARLLPDGTPDSSFRPGFGPDRTVERILLQADGTLIVGGRFTAIDGAPLTTFVARLRSDGTVDPAFAAIGVNGAPANWVQQDDGNLLLGGQPADYYGSAQFGVVRTASTPGPVVVTPPRGATVPAGRRVNLEAVVAGTAGAVYRWQKDGQAVAGATRPALLLSAAQAGDSGEYALRVTAGARVATSAPAVVTVRVSPPVIGGAVGGFGGAIAPGSRWPLTAPVLSAGSEPLAYQWYKDGVAVPGGTARRLFVPWHAADAGVYHVTIANPHGSVTSGVFPQRVATTSDWVWSHPVPQGNPLLAAVFVNGRFLAGGARGTILTSPDGAAWTVRRLGVAESIGGFAYGGGAYVALADFGGLWHSTDAANWTRRDSRAGADGRDLRAVAWGGGRFVAVGDGGLVVTSPDGLTWTAGQAAGEVDFIAVAHGTGGFLALADDGTSQVSTDGIAWAPGVRFPRRVVAVAYGVGRWAVAGGGTIYSSPDGALWLEHPITAYAAFRQLQYQEDGFTGVLEDDYRSSFVTSPDGRIWTKGSFYSVQNGVLRAVRAVAQGAGRWVVASAVPDYMFTSAEGVVWSRPGLPGASDFALTSLAAGGGRLYAGGVSLLYYSGAVWSSSDGVQWSASNTDISGGVFGLAHGNGRLVAVGAGGGIRVKPDDGAWSTAASGTPKSLYGVAHVNGDFLAMGADGTLLASTDGSNWTARTSGVAESLYHAAYGNETYVVVGADGTVLSSTDGLAWTRRPLGGVTAAVGGAAYGAGRFVVVSEAGDIRTSTDGATWTARTNPAGLPLNRIIHAGGRFYAFILGSTFYLISTDGAEWTAAQHGSANSNVAGAEFGGRLFLGGANGAIVSRSLAAVEPVLVAPPVAQAAGRGGAATFAVTAAGTAPLAYQWFKDGLALPGATGATLLLGAVGPADAGDYLVRVTNEAGVAYSRAAVLTVSERGLIASQAQATTAAGALVGAFTVEGAAPKQMLVRAVGPALAAFGVTDFAADPGLRVVRADLGVDFALNDDWGQAANVAQVAATTAQVGAYPLPAGGKDAAVLGTFAPGTYRVEVATAGAGGMVALEIYEADANPRLVYLATQAPVGAAGFSQGFVVSAAVTGRSYLIRALGPSLGGVGALADPRIAVFSGATQVAANDNWSGHAALRAQGGLVGAMPLAPASRDAGLGFEPPAAGAYTVRVNGAAGASGTVLLEVFEVDAQRAATIPLALIALPVNATVSAGQPASLGVVAVGRPLPQYQWKKDGADLPAFGNVFELPAAQLADAGTYAVRVTGGTAAFEASATLTVTAANNATQTVVGRGYEAGGAVTIANALHHTGSPATLGWTIALPAGWTFASDTATTASARPGAGASGGLTWTWSTPPASPVTFSYTLNVPAGETATRTIAPAATVAGSAVAVAPAALAVAWAAPHHAVDTDRNFRISLLELTRMIELYNTRNGTTRTGAYRIEPGGEDGFAAEATRPGSAVVALGFHHSADTNRDGKFGLLELTRTIELYNTRSGTTRTGQYRVLAGTEDGYAPGT